MWNPIQRLIRKGLSPFFGSTTIGSRHLVSRSRRSFVAGSPESLENRQLMAADLVLANTPPRYELRETTQVSVQLTSPIREATVTAYALAPHLTGNATRDKGESVVLFDDGKHGDGQAGDGIYGNRVPLVSRSGSHHIVVKANGVTATDEAFQLETSYDIDVTAAASLIVDSDSDLFAVGRRDGYMQHLARLPTVMWDIAADPFSEWLYVIEHNSSTERLGRLMLDPIAGGFQYETIGTLQGDTINALEFRNDGRLFAADANGIYLVDQATAQMQRISAFPNGERSAGDLAFNKAGSLIASTLEGSVYRYDFVNQVWSTIMSNTRDDLFGLVLEHDLLYAFSSDNEQMLEISTSQRKIEQVKQLSHPQLDNIFGATVIAIGGNGFTARDGLGKWLSLTPQQGTFDRSEVGTWSSNVAWQDVMHADVDGDGTPDVVGRTPQGAWWVGRADGDTLVNEAWGQWGSRVTWVDVQAADVNGDGRDDIIGRANGTWWVAVSTGSQFVNQKWGAWSPRVSWSHTMVADVDGDGRDDVIGRTGGAWWVAKSTGNEFVNQLWGRWSPNVNWLDINVADVDGDGRSDIVGRTATSGEWWVARSNGIEFVTQRWGRWSSRLDWQDVRIMDVNGDGRDDIVGRTDKSWWTASSNGIGFTNHLLGVWAGNPFDLLTVQDVTGDGRDDLIARVGASWIVGKTNGESIKFQFWNLWADSPQWTHVLAG